MTATLKNKFMKIITVNNHSFVKSNGERFLITLISDDLGRVNDHIELWDCERSVISEDEKGRAIVVLNNPGKNVTLANLTNFLTENRDWHKSVPLLNDIHNKFPTEFKEWLEKGSTIKITELAMKTLQVDKRTVEFDNLLMPLDTARLMVFTGGKLS